MNLPPRPTVAVPTVRSDGHVQRYNHAVGDVSTDFVPDNPEMVVSTRMIFAERLDDVTKRVEKWNKLAAKLGLDAEATLTIIESKAVRLSTVSKHRLDPDPWVEMLGVRISGLPIRRRGEWELVAVIDHPVAGRDFEEGTERPGNAVRRLPSAYTDDVPDELFEEEATCGKCGQNRDRHHTLLIRDEHGRFMRVGSSCVKQYMGMSPAQLLSLAESDPFDADDEEKEWGGGQVVPALDFTVAATAVMRREGYRPSSWEGSTKYTATMSAGPIKPEWVANILSGPVLDDDPRSDEEFAADALAWAVGYEGDDEFRLNMRAYAERSSVGRGAGVLAYIPRAYQKELEEANKPAPVVYPPSEWFGTVDEGTGPLVGFTVVKNRRGEIPTFDVGYGRSDGANISLRGPDGHVVLVRTNVSTAFYRMCSDTTESDLVTFEGKVAEHSEYQGTKQTRLVLSQKKGRVFVETPMAGP
jgi:hypothetical protein